MIIFSIKKVFFFKVPAPDGANLRLTPWCKCCLLASALLSNELNLLNERELDPDPNAELEDPVPAVWWCSS